MSDIISVDTIRNGFLIEDHMTFAGPKYAEKTMDMMFDVLTGLFNHYYYLADDEGTPSEEWVGIMAGIEAFKNRVPVLMREWKEEAERIAKRFEPEPTVHKKTVITEEGNQDI